MKRIVLLWVVACTSLTIPAFPRDFLPSWRFEQRQATDGSAVQSLVFDTTAGVRYEIEESDDLVTWTTATGTYGLGQSFAFPMRTIAPAPPPAPGAPIPPTLEEMHHASVVIHSCSSAGGGMVASWVSLENGNAVSCHLTQQIDPAWSGVPIYVQRFDDFLICIIHYSLAIPAPGFEPELAGKDAELFASLEANFAAMSQEVAAAQASASHAPPPAPPDPNARQFYRIRAILEDADHDKSLDVDEFRLASQGHPLADPFRADTDNNGIADGSQMDADGDGIPDAEDSDSGDAGNTIRILPIPRYAAFTKVGGKALQINDRGTVLFTNGVWKDGSFGKLDGAGFRALAINDNDLIVGVRSGAFPSLNTSILCFWENPTATIADVRDAAGNYAGFQTLLEPGVPGVLSNFGEISSHRVNPDGSEDANPSSPNAWRIARGNSFAISRTPGIFFGNAENVGWGYNPDGGLVQLGESASFCPLIPRNVVKAGAASGSYYAITSSDGTFRFDPRTSQWDWEEAYEHAMDIAADGTAIGKSHTTIPSVPWEDPVYKYLPIRLNGNWVELERAAAGLAGRWLDGTMSYLDISNTGWILASRGSGTYDAGGIEDPDFPDMETAVMIPLRVKGIPPNPSFREATGVDDFSVGSTMPGPGVHDRLWIMAPFASEGPNRVTIDAPLTEAGKITIAAPGVKLGPTGIITLQAPSTTFDIIGLSQYVAGVDQPAILRMGANECASVPIGVKPMKARTVPVTLWRIGRDMNPEGVGPGSPGYEAPEEPRFNPDKLELEAYLNAIFSPQLNINFKITIKYQAVKWDTSNPHTLNINADFGEELAPIRSACFDPEQAINIYLPGWATTIRDATTSSVAMGDSNRPLRCAVVVDLSIFTDNIRLMSLMAHEIGHIIVGEGHPNVKDFHGPAPLPGTDHTRRLLVTNDQRRHDGTSCRLVKGEWDAAEIWLNEWIP